METALEVTTTREMDAPREAVFRAWTESEVLERWWGPKDFTNVFHEHDPVPDGRWVFDMLAPDGTRYPNESRYLEVSAPERLVFDHVSGHYYRAVATFEALSPSRTRVTWTMRFEDAEEFEQVKEFIVRGNEENLDRLEGVLAGAG
jgi:uncharacterized protein YndB with AHSA1/START domain